MKHIFLFLLALAPALALAQTGTVKDSVRVLTTAEIAQGNSKDSAHLYFIDTTWKKIRMDSLARFARLKLAGDRGDIIVSADGLTWNNDTLSIDSMQLGAGAVVLPGAKVTGTLPVSKGGTGQNTLTASKVLVGNGTSGVLSPTNLHWDNTNSRLGIGTSTPGNISGGITPILDVIGPGRFASIAYTNLVMDGTNTTGWGNNMAFRAQGVDFGYVGSIGSFLGSTNKDMTFWATLGNGFRVNTNGNSASVIVVPSTRRVGIRVESPGALLHLAEGINAANGAPLKFTSGTNTSTPEAGAMEWDGTNLYMTNSSNVRRWVNQGIAVTSGTINFAATNGGTHDDETVTVTGATAGDVVSLGVPNGAVFDATCYTAWVSADDTVTIRFNNYSGTQRTPSGVFKIFVTKF
jgi:hypothetical protein